VLDSADAGGKLIRGGSIRVSGFVVSLLIGLLSAPLLVRHLSVSDFGLYATVMSLSFVVTGLTEGGIGNVAVREFSQSSDSERERLLTSLIGLRIVLTTIGFCLAILFTRIAGYPPVVTLGVAICAVGVLLGAVQNTLAVPLAASLRLGELTAIDLSRQVTSTIIIVGLVVAGAALVPFFVAYSIAFFALLLATLYVLRGQRIPLRASFDRALWTALLRQTGIFALATAFAVAYFQVALISVSALSTDYQAGLYGAAFRVVDLANGIPWLLAASAFPIVARSAATDPERLRNALQRMFETAVVAGGALSVVIIVGAPVAMAFVGGGKLDQSIPVLQTMGVGIPFTFCIATWSFALLSLRAHRSLLLANGGAFLLAGILTIIFVPRGGAQGAAYITLTLEVLLATVYAIALTRNRRELRVQLLVVAKVVLGALLALAAGLLLGLAPVLATFAAALIYGLIILATKALPPEISEAIRSRLAPSRSGPS
jgi:O-antigen/teichoic acid export membrane protein